MDDDSAIALQLFYSAAYFVRTHDKGRSWEPARAIFKIRDDAQLLEAAGIGPATTDIYGDQNIGHQIVILPDKHVLAPRGSYIPQRRVQQVLDKVDQLKAARKEKNALLSQEQA